MILVDLLILSIIVIKHNKLNAIFPSVIAEFIFREIFVGVFFR